MKAVNTIKKIHHDNNGFSLIELLVAIVLLVLIVGAFLSAYEFATRTNITSADKVDEGYIAQTCMEEIINFNNEGTGIAELTNSMQSNGYNYANPETDRYVFTKIIDNYYVKVEMTKDASISVSPELTKVLVGVYEDTSHSKLVASIQNIITI